MNHAIVEENVVQHNNRRFTTNASAALIVSDVIERNIVRFNGIADFYVVYLNGTESFAWNTIVGNDSSFGTVIVERGGVIHHNTIAGNASVQFSTVSLSREDLIEFRNNVVVHGNWKGLDCAPGPRVVACNDVWGLGPSYNGACANVIGMNGNISADPLFCDPTLGDYRLQQASPCAPANSPLGCGLIGALPVCAAAGIDGTAPRQHVSLRVEPNPASDAGTAFVLSHELEGAAIEIYNSAGRLVDLLRPTGTRIRWTGAAKSPRGVYFARLSTGAATEVVKFVLVR